MLMNESISLLGMYNYMFWKYSIIKHLDCFKFPCKEWKVIIKIFPN